MVNEIGLYGSAEHIQPKAFAHVIDKNGSLYGGEKVSYSLLQN